MKVGKDFQAYLKIFKKHNKLARDTFFLLRRYENKRMTQADASLLKKQIQVLMKERKDILEIIRTEFCLRFRRPKDFATKFWFPHNIIPSKKINNKQNEIKI